MVWVCVDWRFSGVCFGVLFGCGLLSSFLFSVLEFIPSVPAVFFSSGLIDREEPQFMYSVTRFEVVI